MVIDGMLGLGDNIYQRSVVRELNREVYLRTVWPQLYADLPNIKPVCKSTKLRTQAKNLIRQPDSVWFSPPSHRRAIKLVYTSHDLKYGSILASLEKRLRIKAKIFDIPNYRKPIDIKKYAIVRPVTVRSEWYNHARGAKPEYICMATKLLQREGYIVISVADICKNEWCKSLPEADIKYNHGELVFEELMGVIQHASIVIGGVGWIVPACAATKTPLITILGGQGGHNAPEKIISHPMNTDKIKFIQPENYCMCRDNRHACDKTINNFAEKFLNALGELNGH